MDGIGAITARISQIQGYMDSLGAGSVGGVLGGTTVTTSATTTGSGTSLSGLTSGLTGTPGLTGATGLAGMSGLTGSPTAFDALLAQATGATTGVGGGKALLNADGVPSELARYGNGKIPTTALSQVEGTSQSLWAPAARSLEALRSAAAADGVKIGVTDGYRTYESQVSLVKTKGLYSQGGLAAAPGTSNHGWGMAADLALDSEALAWMRQNAGRFGFVEDTPRESWHWGYHPTS